MTQITGAGSQLALCVFEENTDWTDKARIGETRYFQPHPVLALPKRPSPFARRGRSRSDRVR
jgi:hypothetical protein